MGYTSMIAAVAAGAKPSSFDPETREKPDLGLSAKIAENPLPYHSKFVEPPTPDFSGVNSTKHTNSILGQTLTPVMLVNRMIV